MGVLVESLDDDAVLVSVTAALDYDHTRELDEVLTGLVHRNVRRLLVDLSAAVPVDDGAVGVLFRALREVRGQGGAVALAVPDRQLREVLATMGLDRVFRVGDDLVNARRLLGLPRVAPAAG